MARGATVYAANQYQQMIADRSRLVMSACSETELFGRTSFFSAYSFGRSAPHLSAAMNAS
jgi:hypothetical protein